jgi:putative membrane protein
MVRPFYQPHTYDVYWRLMGVILIAAGLSFCLLLAYSRFILWLINRFNYRSLSVVTFFMMVGVVYGFFGWQGLGLMTVATGIGLVPVYYHSRRMNCMGVLLVPITLNMGGLGPAGVKFLGLI